MSVYVTGACGQLGHCLKDVEPSYNFLTIDDLDITDEVAVKEWAKKTAEPTIINLAAYTQVDKAESEETVVKKVHVDGVKHLASVANRFITISTDFVFDGKKTTPYIEEDPTNPLGVYGATKLEGEHVALATNSNAIVVRTSWLFSPYKVNFVKRMLELSAERDELRIVNDQRGGPTSCLDLARALVKIVNTEVPAGVYHFSNSGEATWYELAKRTLELKGVKTPIHPITTSDYPTPATRPAYSVMSTEKLSAAIQMDIPHWHDALKEVVDHL